jgi:hypothetical protein
VKRSRRFTSCHFAPRNAIIECRRIVMCCNTPNGSALKCNPYAATTAIGVISTMISGMAKEAAVSNVLAGNSVP